MTVRGRTYVPTWQTWSFVRREAPGATEATPSKDTCPRLRERMQIARIEQRLTVLELAQRVHCDVETLAAFERGEEILDDTTQRRLRRELKL